MVKLLSYAAALALTSACLDEPAFAPRHLPAAEARALGVVVDERVPLGALKFPIRPSLVLDDAGRPQVFVTLWRDGADIAGFMRRDADGWRHVEVVRGPSAGVGFGGGLAYGHLDRGADGALEVWIWRDADGATAHDNRTDVLVSDGDAWRVVDSVPDVEVHQVVRDADREIVALLAHYGGNGYVVEPTVGDAPWRATLFPLTTYRPVGVLTPEGTIAALARLELTHFEGPREPIAPGADAELHPLGPALGPNGQLHVLRQRPLPLGHRLTLSTRARRDVWSHALVAAEPEVPSVASCPAELGRPCAFETTRTTAAGLVVLPSGEPLWLGARQPIEVAYQRQCLTFEPDYQGCAMPPCADEGGPAGPWLASPAVTPTGPATLVVGGAPLPAEVPPTFQPALGLDETGDLHVAWLEQDALRYLRIELPTTAP
ncbi:MAG: hypothetical protein IT385_26650 [Deltaproteobacteria bacterium]|nr:hypothetical protein [Deltaproteobacteria bacterium]